VDGAVVEEDDWVDVVEGTCWRWMFGWIVGEGSSGGEVERGIIYATEWVGDCRGKRRCSGIGTVAKTSGD
jgi:hypothetical protein